MTPQEAFYYLLELLEKWAINHPEELSEQEKETVLSSEAVAEPENTVSYQ